MADTHTVYASIGNSDDKLTQARWAEFHGKVTATVRSHALRVYGDWTSGSADPWQNACIGFEIGYETAERLRRDLAELAAEYGQDSIAWAEAETRFIAPVTSEPAVTPTVSSLADDALDWARKRELYEDRASGAPVTIHQDPDGTVRIVDPPDVVAIDIALLRNRGLSGVAFTDGILTVEAKSETVRYRLLHATDHGFTIVFRREDPAGR
jgi:hypothetical protein